MATNNFILLTLLDDNVIERNIVEYLVEDLQENTSDNFDVTRRIRQKNEHYFEGIVPLYNGDLFKVHFRMSRAAVEELVNIIGNIRVQHRNNSVELEKQILFTIWILSKEESYLAAGDRFGFSKSTGHGILKEIVTVLVELIPRYIVWPNSEKCNSTSNIFARRSGGFPGVVGAIDGTHIPCKAPIGNANDYYNRKGFHSIILQGVCDHAGRFIHIFVGMPGRMHDARVFRNSEIYRGMTNEDIQFLPPHPHLIGDAAYPLMHNLMTPFRDSGHLLGDQLIYNKKLSSIRSIIERAFGLLKFKWRRLKYLDISDFVLGKKMIGATCVLHNFMINGGEASFEEEDTDHTMLISNDDYTEIHQNRNDFATAKRNDIINLFR